MARRTRQRRKRCWRGRGWLGFGLGHGAHAISTFGFFCRLCRSEAGLSA
jgi:hypothetical protein